MDWNGVDGGTHESIIEITDLKFQIRSYMGLTQTEE